MPVRSSTTQKYARGAAATVLMVAALVAPSFAGPPLLTDDPETLPEGEFELNTTYRLTLSAPDAAGGRTWEHEAPLFDLAYGLFENVQVKFEVPLLAIDPAGNDPAHAGIGDASIGSKIRFLKEDEAPFELAIYPAIGLPLGTRSRGLGTGSASLVLPVEIGRHFLDDRLWIYGDAGYEDQFAKGEGDLWFTGLAAEYNLSDDITLVGEVHFEFGLQGAPDDSLINVGVKWKLTDYASFIGAIGRSFDPSQDAGIDLLLNVGVQWSF